MNENVKEDVCYPQPHTLQARVAIASDFARRFQYPIPLGVDSMDDRAMKLYAGWPERIYIVGEDGRIVYKGGIGPFSYHPEEMQAWLEKRSAQPPR